jgi:hypothetical protein
VRRRAECKATKRVINQGGSPPTYSRRGGAVHAASGHGDAPLLQLEVSATTKKGLARHAPARLLHHTALPRVLRQPPLKAGVPVPGPVLACASARGARASAALRCRVQGAKCKVQSANCRTRVQAGALPCHDDAATGALCAIASSGP